MKEKTMEIREDFMKEAIVEILKGHKKLVRKCIEKTTELKEKKWSEIDIISIEQSIGLLDSEEKIVNYLFKCYLEKGSISFESDIEEYFAEVERIRNRQIIYA